MKRKNIIMLLTFAQFIISSASLFANAPKSAEAAGNNISGRILDSNTGEPLEYVSIAAYKSADSTLVTGTISDMEGKFQLADINSGEYYLKINYVGFEKKQTEKISIDKKNRKADLGDIKLNPIATKIEAAVVTAEKSRVEYKIDKRVINVDKDINAKGGSAVNVLENTPSVQVDPQGNVTLRGSSEFIVLIDGKPSVLKGSDALKQLPASAIKQIEVITNPSAKYDAEGQAGIINVIMKKDRLQGFNGNLNTAAGSNDSRSANLLTNYRQGKTNFFIGIDYANNTFKNDITLNNITMQTSDHEFIKEEANQFNQNTNINFKGGIDYDLNENNSFSMSGSFGHQGYDNGTDARFHIYNNSNSKNFFSTSKNFMDVDGDVMNFNADYTHKFGDNHTLSITNTYGQWRGLDKNNLDAYFTNSDYSNKNSISSMTEYEKNNHNFNYRLNIDYKRPIAKGVFETGFQYRLEDRYEDFNYYGYNSLTQNLEYLDSKSYELDYINTIYSGYATYSDSLFGLAYQLGVRSEMFLRGIDISNMGGRINFDKFMFYPSVHISKEINGHQFQLSYSRRINRPEPWLLNNTPFFIDPQNIFIGSPYLEPEFTDAYEFNYRKNIDRFTLSTQTYFRYTTNSFQSLRLLKPDGIMYHQLTNSDNQQALGVELGLDVNLFKWWSINSGANIYNYTLNTLVSSTNQKQEVNTWDARLISNFNMKWGTRIQAIGYYRAASVDAQGKSDGFYTTNLAINQSLMKGALNMGLSVQNLLNSINFDYKAKSATYDNTYHIMSQGPVFMFNLSYSFNNFQYKSRGRADDTEFKGGGAF